MKSISVSAECLCMRYKLFTSPLVCLTLGGVGLALGQETRGYFTEQEATTRFLRVGPQPVIAAVASGLLCYGSFILIVLGLAWFVEEVRFQLKAKAGIVPLLCRCFVLFIKLEIIAYFVILLFLIFFR
jgi:hypothetical protein